MQSSNTIVTCDVAVVGAGVFGAWTAFHLQQAGQSVALIDAYGVGIDQALKKHLSDTSPLKEIIYEHGH